MSDGICVCVCVCVAGYQTNASYASSIAGMTGTNHHTQLID
jgi:hypothetical protein